MSFSDTSLETTKGERQKHQERNRAGGGKISAIGELSTEQKDQDHRVQIFLGGSCNPTTWRQKVAIPHLELHGISYYNPQIDNWTPEVVNIEQHAKKNADYLLFVIDRQTRSTVSLVESAFLAGDGKRLVLVIYPFDYSINHLSIQSDTKQTSSIVETQTTRTSTTRLIDSSMQSTCSSKSSTSSRSTTTSSSNFASGFIKVNDESLSFGEFQELRQARCILQSLVSLHRVPTFSDIGQALRYVTDRLLIRDTLGSKNESSHIGDQGGSERDLGSYCGSPIDDNASQRDCFQNTVMNHGQDQDNLRDVYISFDDNGDSSLEAIIPLLKERGLSFIYKPVRNLSKLDALRASSRMVSPSDEVSFDLDEMNSGIERYTKGEFEDNEQTVIQDSGLALESELKDIRRSRVILVVISNKCRGLSIMVLASHFMALFRRNIVLCIQYLEESCCINGETLTKNAIADYNRGRMYLGDYAMESQVPVFGTIREAVDCCSERCGYSTDKRELKEEIN